MTTIEEVPVTDDQAIALGRRAVAARGFRWMERMAVRAVMADGSVEVDVGTVIGDDDGMPLVYWPNLDDGRGSDHWSRKVRLHHPTEHLVLVFDGATVGLLRALVREVHEDPVAEVIASDHVPGGEHFGERAYGLAIGARGWIAWYDTEVEPLIVALETDPGVFGRRGQSRGRVLGVGDSPLWSTSTPSLGLGPVETEEGEVVAPTDWSKIARQRARVTPDDDDEKEDDWEAEWRALVPGDVVVDGDERYTVLSPGLDHCGQARCRDADGRVVRITPKPYRAIEKASEDER